MKTLPIALILASVAGATSVAFLWPSAESKRIARATPAQRAQYLARQASYQADVAVGDRLFLTGRPEAAREHYEAIQADLSRHHPAVRGPDSEVACKIAASYMAQGRYDDAMETYREAERVNPHDSIVSDGRVRALMVYLASWMGDEATLETFIREEIALDRPPPSDGPARTEDPEARAFIFFGRQFAQMKHRSGMDWAYARALKGSEGETSISYEWAGHTSGLFNDTEAEIRILRAARPTKDEALRDFMRESLRVAESQNSVATSDYRSAARDRRLDEKKLAFEAWGVYEPERKATLP